MIFSEKPASTFPDHALAHFPHNLQQTPRTAPSLSFVFAGLDPAIHDECPRMQTVRLCFAVWPHGCPGHRRAKRRRPSAGYARARQTRGSAQVMREML